MPVPWEALIPFGESNYPQFHHTIPDFLGLLTAMFGAAGTLLNVSYRAQNQGKVRKRRWEVYMSFHAHP